MVARRKFVIRAVTGPLTRLPGPSEGCEARKPAPDESNWTVLECKSRLDPEHEETTDEAVVVAPEHEEHAVTAACPKVAACTACKAALVAAASMAAKISGVKDVFWPADIESTTDNGPELEILEAAELSSADAEKIEN